ncbi:MAG: hypothetical protein K6G80_12065 [Treponema sp.]|nr:hypothetical protein [Treponema sp.]
MKKCIIKVMGTLLLAGLLAGNAAAQSRKTEIWDFGGVQSAGDVINHITTADIDAIPQLPAGGRFSEAGEASWGDLTVNFLGNDRMYFESKAGKSAGSQGYVSLDFGDGYISNGIYYCNGSGGEKRRYMLIKNVRAGDVITFYAGTSNTSSKDIHFAHLKAGKDQNIGTDILVLSGEQDEHAPIVQASQANPGRYSYIALADGTYKIFTDSSAGKPVYYRVVRTPGVPVSGNLTGESAKGGSLSFLCRETNQQLKATVSGSKYAANLAPGYSYTAILTGVPGYSIAGAAALVDLQDAKAGVGRSIPLAVSEIKSFKIDGTITGIAESYDVSSLSVVLLPPEGSFYQNVECKTEKTGSTITYTGSIEPNVRYTITLHGANDYEVAGEAFIEETKAVTRNISVKERPVYAISGSFIGEANPAPQTVTFTHTDGYSYTGTITGGAYSASLRDGTYTVTADNGTASTTNHVIVSGKPVKKDINLVKKDQTLAALPLKKDIYVGGKKADYKSLTEAVLAVKAMNPQSEKDRVTIHIAPGVYRQQLIIETPFITLKNDTPAQEVKLTWYYGIGYQYYSADEKGFYNADLAHDKFTKAGVARWGVATYVKPTATAFRAEGITFESSFNKYVCDEEIADGVEPDGSLPFVRRISSDVRAKKATERATALCSEADRSEYIDCRFIGSQDTLYTGDKTHQYFKRCYIEGQTDFIFGGGDALFENCEISWCGYSNGGTGGYLTAARNPEKTGYVFYNCLLSANQSFDVEDGFLGRPWGQNAKVAFINLSLSGESLLQEEGWTKMSANSPEKAGFREFGTTLAGTPISLENRVKGTVLKSADGYSPREALGEWTPVYYADSKDAARAKAKFGKKPSLSSNDDINTPYPGHTLTLSYSLGKGDSADVSSIDWYREKNGTKELVRSGTGFAGKTYLLTSTDQKAKISVTVTPRLRNGSEGAPVTVELKAEVKEGHAIVATEGAGGARAEDKVNIFLAGDSTVRDYSDKGMWSGGKNRDEGAWGEFLAAWFNSSVAVQNYANGGRSSRNFINEKNLSKISSQIKSGDYLFIQFGHNDENLKDPDRGVILGKADSKGVYPVTEGKKSETGAAFVSKYGPESYTETSGGSFKWFLKQYVDAARAKGATPVLVTPVSRLYFTADGKIRAHHDADGEKTPVNSYVTAVRQLASEENVLLIDGFEITKNLYESAWADTGRTAEKARYLMTEGDSTHNSKTGGFIIAGLFAKAIKKAVPALGSAVVKPSRVSAVDQNGRQVFSVDSKGSFSCDDEYWTAWTQKLLDSF